MNLKLKLAFIKQSSEKGFAFPLAMLVGLIMVVTGMSMVIRSQSDQSKVSAQQVKAKSLGITETGITRIQDYLNSFRILATYPSSCEALEQDSISSNDNDCWAKIQTSSGTLSTSSTPTFQPKVNEVVNACTNDSKAREMLQIKLEDLKELAEYPSQWKGINDNDSNYTRQYKLISYEYQPDPGVGLGNAPGTGILTLQGRYGNAPSAPSPSTTPSPSNGNLSSSPSPSTTPSPSSASGSSNTNDPPTDNSESNNRLIVRIPVVVPALPDIFNSNSAPGLWIKEGATNDGANETIGSNGTYSNGSNFNGSVAMSDDCSFRASSDLRKNIETYITNERIQQTSYKDEDGFDAVTEYKAQFVDLDFPELPTLPTARVPVAQQNLTLNGARTFPNTATDTKTTVNGQQVYEYIINSIELNGNKDITITPGQKVIFYVKGNIAGNGTGGIKHDCRALAPATSASKDKNKSKKTDSKTTTSIVNLPPLCPPTDFQIYAYNSLNITNPQICLNGDSQLEAFIFAPNYAVGKIGNGTFVGSLWGKSWGKIPNCGSNNSKVAIIQGASWNLLPSAMKPQAAPRIGQVTTLEQVSVEEVATPTPTTAR